MKTTLGNLKRVISEALLTRADLGLPPRNDWVVRKGAEVLVKGVDDSADAWHYEELPKVTYFTMDELVDFPSGPQSNKNFKFERDGKLYAVAERQFFLMPPRTQG